MLNHSSDEKNLIVKRLKNKKIRSLKVCSSAKDRMKKSERRTETSLHAEPDGSTSSQNNSSSAEKKDVSTTSGSSIRKFSIVPVTDDVRKELSFPKVELHVHLDGAVRHQTLLDLSLEKGIDLKGAETVEDVRRLVVIQEPSNLSKVLGAFDLYLPATVGDKDAVERIACELCEDQAKYGVIYFEARYAPHFLANTAKNISSTSSGGCYNKKGTLDPRGVVEAVKRGFDRGEADFHVKARSILCRIRGYADWNDEILEMEAAKSGIHRTVHAGESGGSKEVILAIDDMKAERIGHGYRLLRDETAYKKL